MTVSPPAYTNMVICGQTEDRRGHYRGRIEKVKFGVPVAEAFSHDIPATLLVLLLKVNKEGPMKKDIWRAPGNQTQVRKLVHVMQHGRLINISNFTVYTAASVIKKFLAKIPNGVFGLENEERLFSLLQQDDPEKQRDSFCRVVSSLPVPSQHLLVLLFGTFRVIADASDSCGTRMSPEAIGVSVAPSLFHTCILDGQRAKIEDVVRFRIASQVVTFIITNFGYTNLFPRDNYEFYARITGRTLRVDDRWLFTFQYPASDLVLQQEWLKSEAQKLSSGFQKRPTYDRTGGISSGVSSREMASSSRDDHVGSENNNDGMFPSGSSAAACGDIDPDLLFPVSTSGLNIRLGFPPKVGGSSAASVGGGVGFCAGVPRSLSGPVRGLQERRQKYQIWDQLRFASELEPAFAECTLGTVSSLELTHSGRIHQDNLEFVRSPNETAEFSFGRSISCEFW